MRGYGAIGSASDSRSGGWEFDSLWPHSFILTKIIELSNEFNTLGLSKQISLKNVKCFVKLSPECRQFSVQRVLAARFLPCMIAFENKYERH